jgi:flagellar basal body-associated protein FliL
MPVQKSVVKKRGWRILLIIVIAAVVVAGVIVVTNMFITIHEKDKFEEALSSYFKFKAEGNIEGLSSLTSGKIEDELSSLDLKGKKYSLYSYSITDENITNNTNSAYQAKKITFSITLTAGNTPVSYLCEAYLYEESNSIKVEYIRVIYKGKDITKIWQNRPFHT